MLGFRADPGQTGVDCPRAVNDVLGSSAYLGVSQKPMRLEGSQAH